MRRALYLATAISFFSLLGCASTTSYVETNATLGRVVVYRNGIAYYERTAEVTGSELELAVPADKVDDFLKSLTVVDADTKQPTPIAYPTRPNVSNTGIILMKIQLKDPGTEDDPKKLLLSYVTEAPSWKPSYRITIGKNKKVDLEGWAIVDNTSGEDWNNVKLGVGSSSALSFRYDLHSVRNVSRVTLAPTDLFAQAPPTGMSVYANGQGVVDFVDDATLADTRGPSYDRDGDEEMSGTDVAETTTLATRTEGRNAPAAGAVSKPADKANQKKKPEVKKEAEQQISAGEYRIQTLAERVKNDAQVGSSRVDLQACKLEYSIVSPK